MYTVWEARARFHLTQPDGAETFRVDPVPEHVVLDDQRIVAKCGTQAEAQMIADALNASAP